MQVNKSISDALKKSMFHLYSEKYPALTKAVTDAIISGKTPNAIHAIFTKRLGKQSMTAANIGLIAEYIKENLSQQ